MLPFDQRQVGIRGRAEPVIDLRQLVFHGDQRGKNAFHLIPQRAGSIRASVLLHIADAGILCANDFAGIVRDFAGNHPEQRGFAAAVIADQTDFIAVTDVKGDITEQTAFTEIFLQFMDRKNGHIGLTAFPMVRRSTAAVP